MMTLREKLDETVKWVNSMFDCDASYEIAYRHYKVHEERWFWIWYTYDTAQMPKVEFESEQEALQHLYDHIGSCILDKDFKIQGVS